MVSCLSHISEEDLSLADARSKHLNECVLILSDLNLHALSYISPITAISQLPEYQLYYVHKIIWWPCRKVSKIYEGPLGYVEGSSLTL